MNDIPIPEIVFASLAADPSGPLREFPRFSRNREHPLHASATAFMNSLPEEYLSHEASSSIMKLHGIRQQGLSTEQFIREMVAIKLLDEAISRRRLIHLSDHTSRPAPYNLSALADLDIDEDGLVSLKAFDCNGSTLSHNGHCFMLVPPAEVPNSSYWLLQRISQKDIKDCMSVRLDPFLHGPERDFAQIHYKMDVYGRALDWERVGKLSNAEHGQWMADSENAPYEFTDYVWDPRSDGIHFVCEELPIASRVDGRGARYLHSIYAPSSKEIIHLDGALRIYTKMELEARRKQHVRNAGKTGKRIKLFKIDSSLSREVMTDIASTFFLWNDDAQRYFAG